MATPNPGLILFIGLMVWGVIRRIRRSVGRQKLRPVRITISLVIFSLISVLFIAAAVKLQQMNLLAGIGGGMVLGAALGFLGLRLTRFETTTEGYFYTPNTQIGIALSILFVGRMLYRMWGFQDATYATSHPQPLQSPLTYFIIGLVAGYYLVYYIGLFVHTHDQVIPQKTTVPPPL